MAAAESLVNATAKKIVNRFSALDADSDEDEVVKPTKSAYSSRTPMSSNKRKHEELQFDFPTLSTGATVVTTNSNQMNFAKAVLIPDKPVAVLAKPIAIPDKPIVLLTKSVSIALSSRPCWADSESDDEDTESDRQRCADEYMAIMEAREQAIVMRRCLEEAAALNKFNTDMNAKKYASIKHHRVVGTVGTSVGNIINNYDENEDAFMSVDSW